MHYSRGSTRVEAVFVLQEVDRARGRCRCVSSSVNTLTNLSFSQVLHSSHIEL